jgi:hypothetical protein
MFMHLGWEVGFGLFKTIQGESQHRSSFSFCPKLSTTRGELRDGDTEVEKL